MFWFHRHEFDPEKWKLIQESSVSSVWNPEAVHYYVYLYSNTCTKCGELVFRKTTSQTF